MRLRLSTWQARRARRLGAQVAVVSAIWVAALVPSVRDHLSRAEPGMAFGLLTLGLVAAAARGALRARAGRGARTAWRAGSVVRRLTAQHGMALSVLVFLLPIWAAWALHPPGPVSAYAALFGRLPWSDAANYHAGAHRLLSDGSLDAFNERRPLNAALLAVRLAVCGEDLGWAAVVQGALLGLAAWFAARAMGARFGLPAGLVTFSVLLAVGRLYVATTLSEPLGLTLGCCAFALLVAGARRRDVGRLAAGTFGLALALSARAGAVLVLPLLVVGGVLAVPRRGRALGSLLAAALLAAGVSGLLLRSYGSPGARPFSNFAPTAVALSSGRGDWASVLESRRDRLASLSESEAASELYAEAWDHVRRDPRPLLGSLARGLVRSLVEEPPYVADALAFPGGTTLARWLAGAVVVLGALGLYRDREEGRWLWPMTALGLVLSAPVTLPVGGPRVLAATDPFVAGYLALGVAAGRGTEPAARVRTRRLEARLRRHDRGALLLLVTLPLLALVGPGLFQGRVDRPPDAGSLGADEVLVRTGPALLGVVVDPSGADRCGEAPVITRRAFRLGLTGGAMEESERLGRLRPPFAFLVVYDQDARRDRYLVAPPEITCARGPYLRLRLRPLLESRYVEEVVSFEDAQVQ